jgi:nucleotide-binding universal stress UspA family protein
MTQSRPRGPALFCYDGSEGSREALKAAAEFIERSAEVVVITVWEPIATRLALSGAFVSGSLPNVGELDQQEEAFARAASEDGAQRAVEHGYKASAMTRESTEGIARAILGVADEICARIIVCGQRGRGPITSALLGSVSHALASHTRRPLLIAPEKAA